MRKTLVATFTVLLLLLIIPSTQAQALTVPTNVYFGLPAYGTYINFSTQQTFIDIYRENNYWYFNGYGFRVQNANLTITDFDFTNDKLYFTVTASSGTSTTRIYCGDKGQPTSVDGATSWAYNAATKIATINVTHLSSKNVQVEWVATSFISFMRGNYYLIFALIGIMPLTFGALLIIGILKNKETLEPNDITALIALVITMLIAFIIVYSFMNATIGG